MSETTRTLEGTLSTFAEVKRANGNREWFKVTGDGEHVSISEEEYRSGTVNGSNDLRSHVVQPTRITINQQEDNLWQ